MRDAFRERLQSDTELDDLPDHALLNIIQIPRERQVSPWALITRRVFYALLLLTGVSLLVYLDKDGYNEPLTFIDAVYYSAVSLSTVGYGDIGRYDLVGADGRDATSVADSALEETNA